MRAFFSAHSTAYTTNLTYVHNVFALAFGRAGYVYWRGGGDALYDTFGAGVYARPATYASVGVYFRKLIGNFNRAFGADNRTVAATKAAVFAKFISAE